MRPLIAMLAVLAGSSPNPETRGWVEHEYRDEVTIRTDNVVARVWVRFMSLGPGFCAG